MRGIDLQPGPGLERGRLWPSATIPSGPGLMAIRPRPSLVFYLRFLIMFTGHSNTAELSWLLVGALEPRGGAGLLGVAYVACSTSLLTRSMFSAALYRAHSHGPMLGAFAEGLGPRG